MPSQFNTNRLATAVLWVAVAKWTAQVLSWSSLFILVRYLNPADFGISTAAFSYVGFVSLVSEFGIGSAIVSLRDLTTKQVAALNSLCVLLGLVACLGSVVFSSFIGAFFRMPTLVPALNVMSTTFLISGFKSIPYATLQKQQRFRIIAVGDSLQMVVSSIVSIAFAIASYGVWSIVFGIVVGLLINTLFTLMHAASTFAVPQYILLKDVLVFSWRTVVSRICWYLYSTADFAVAGRTLGPAMLGVYSVAWNFAHVPSEKIVALILTVTPSFLAAAQDNRAELRSAFLSLSELLLVILAPALGGLVVIVHAVVPLLLGKQWDGAVIPIQLLALYTLINAFVSLISQVFLVTGNVRYGMWLNVLMLGILPVGFIFCSRWGPVGIACAWVSLYPLLSVMWFRKSFQTLSIAPGDFVRALLPPTVSTLIMMTSVELVKLLCLRSSSPVISLTVEVVIGVVVYMGVLWRLFPLRLAQYRYVAKEAFLGARNKTVDVSRLV